MKKSVFILAMVVVMAVFLKIGTTYGADDRTPGSNKDPLITKSYLDERLRKVSVGQGEGFQKVVIPKRSAILLESGSLLVIHAGNGTVKGREGLINTSRGVLFKEGDSAVKYNIFLAPDEKCGIIATDKLTVFVSGGYTVK